MAIDNPYGRARNDARNSAFNRDGSSKTKQFTVDKTLVYWFGFYDLVFLQFL